MTSPRQILGFAGIALLLLGMAGDSELVVWLAIGLLGVSVGLRAIAGFRARYADDSDAQQD
jgi:hypothetical protein